MENAEKIALKAACIQAAAILVAAQPQVSPLGRGASPAPDTAACVRFARDLFGKLTGEAWD
jgi:hypothetical protein